MAKISEIVCVCPVFRVSAFNELAKICVAFLCSVFGIRYHRLLGFLAPRFVGQLSFLFPKLKILVLGFLGSTSFDGHFPQTSHFHQNCAQNDHLKLIEC